MIPPSNSSGDFPQISPSLEENIDALTQMLVASPLTYERDLCQALFEKIKATTEGLSKFEKPLSELEEILKTPESYDSLTIQRTLSHFRGL